MSRGWWKAGAATLVLVLVFLAGAEYGERRAARRETSKAQPTTRNSEQPGTSAPSPSPPAADGACAACAKAVAAGDVVGAIAQANECQDAAKKNACLADAKSTARGAAKIQALNGQCAQAEATIQAGATLGAKGLDKVLTGTSCK